MRTNRLKRVGSAFIASVLLTGTASPAQAETKIPIAGGPGGSYFTDTCPAGQNLLGFDLRVGDDVDAIRPICAISRGPTDTSPLTPDFASNPDGWHGGPDGQFERLICPPRTPIVYAMTVHSEGVDTPIVNGMRLTCGEAVAIQSPHASSEVAYDGPGTALSWPLLGSVRSNHSAFTDQRCPDGQVAVGLHGSTGIWVDAIGLVCDAPRFDPNYVKSVGRIRTGAVPGEPIPLCEAARIARARNSPAASGLEQQCADIGKIRPVGRVVGASSAGSSLSICEAAQAARNRNSPAAPGLEQRCAESTSVRATGRVTGTGVSGPPLPICDAAAQARDRNSPAAEGLKNQCLALGGRVPDPPPVVAAPALPDINDLAAAGATIARADRMSAELRSRQPRGPIRFGFDVGMGAAEGQTEWGPGKDTIMRSLGAAEQEGFKVAISFVLDRNRNAALAATGAQIARRDGVVARARMGEDDVRYWLGFDIASGIFGPQKWGAQGNTLEGPGSTAIREALSPVAQRGFRSSVQLHLSRHY